MTILRGDLKDGAQWTEPAEIEVGAHNGSPQRGPFLEDFKLQKMGFLQGKDVDVAKFRGLTSKSIGDVSGNVDLPSKQSGLNQFLVGKLAGRNRISPTNLGSSSRKLLSEQKKIEM